jgi:transposase InsO family protein
MAIGAGRRFAAQEARSPTTPEPLREWCAPRTIELVFIQPATPKQNADIERFNRTDRTAMPT